MRSIFVCFAFCIFLLQPSRTEAAVFSNFRSLLESRAEAASQSGVSVQTMPLPKPAMNIDPNPAKGGGEVIIDGDALVPEEGPSGTIADIEKPKSAGISRYVVREGDTLSGIARMFGVTVNTIRWANSVSPQGTIRVGDVLVILPVTGVKYTTKQGDTLTSIAKKFGADSAEIASFNNIDGPLAGGVEIIIPDGEIAAPPAAAGKKGALWTKVVNGAAAASEYVGYYLRPLVGGTRSQGVHGYNGVDLAAPVGTPVLAAAPGEVIVAKGGGWNGGYGTYVVIKHGNGSQTLYGHESSIVVKVGDFVERGDVIGYVGATGKSTGPHLHFEIRGGPRNPF